MRVKIRLAMVTAITKKILAPAITSLLVVVLLPQVSPAGQQRTTSVRSVLSPYAAHRVDVPLTVKTIRSYRRSLPLDTLPKTHHAVVPDLAQTVSPGSTSPRAQASGSISPGISWEGLASTLVDNRGVTPPDMNGDVGANQYVQSVNTPTGTAVAVWDKTTGTLQMGPIQLSSLWPSGACRTHGEGDPIVQYDQYAQRWILSQFAFDVSSSGDPVAPYYECIAVSTSEDATGSYFPYSFSISNLLFPDFPKFGVWPGGSSGGYFMSAHFFDSTGAYTAQGIVALDRDRMLAGDTSTDSDPQAILVFASAGNTIFGAMPADAQSTLPPPAGSPNYLAVMNDDAVSGGNDGINLYGFFVDWTDPNSSYVGGPISLDDTKPFDTVLCGGGERACIPQKDTDAKLEAVSGLLSYPLAYRNFGTYDALSVANTVDLGNNRAGIRWYELRYPQTRPEITQEGTVGASATDGLSRWMGSLTMDQSGDIGIGYSISGTSMYPSIAYTGRAASDPQGETPQGETIMMASGGFQAGSPRWGDYSAMAIDPSDGCTFYYTNEYYPASSSNGQWHTRVGSFRFPSCGEPPPAPVADTTPPQVQDSLACPRTFTPTGRTKRKTRILWIANEQSAATVKIVRKATGKVVIAYAGDVGPYAPIASTGGACVGQLSVWQVIWNGKDFGGRYVAAGDYRYSIGLVDDAGNAGAKAKGTITVKR